MARIARFACKLALMSTRIVSQKAEIASAKSALRAAGLRATGGRAEVLAVVLSARSPLAAREAIARLAKKGRQSAGTATVYRALAALTRAGLLRRIPASDEALYEPARDAAAPQLVCTRCGKMEEVRDPEVKRFNESVMKKRGVSADAGALLLYADCRRKECDDS